MFKFTAFLVLFFVPIFAGAQTFEKKVLISPLTENASRYYYVPFDIPAGTDSFSVSYEYDKKNGANVLDLGIFDPNYDESGQTAKGLRGWSGGRRNTVFISKDAATNGYVPGKINAGTWRVVFGLYKVAPEGVKVAVKVRFNEIDSQAQAELDNEKNKSFSLPLFKPHAPPEQFGGYAWYRGDLHMHTFHSDGNWTLPMLLAWAQASGLDFVGLTEHNTYSHHAEVKRLAPNYKNLLILRGEEVTTYGGHFNVWGLPENELIDFRVAPKDTNRLRQVKETVRALGLLASLNHPTALCGGCDWSYGDWRLMDSVEIWNGPWDAEDESALKTWDELLQSGQKIVAIGSSDTHDPPLPTENPPANARAVGSPTNHVGMKKLSETELLAAIRAGRVWISDQPVGYGLEFSAHNGGETFNIGEEFKARNDSIRINLTAKGFPAGSAVLLISKGRILSDEKIGAENYILAKEFTIDKYSYFRVEVRNAKGKMLAFTNPLYLPVK